MAGEAAEVAAHGFDLVPVVALLAAAVVAVPIFKRAGLGPVLGYLAAGLAIGPCGIGLFHDAAGDPARRRARRRALPLHHRPRDAALAPLVDAPRHLRPRPRPGRRLHAAALDRRADARLPAGAVADRRHRLRAHLDRDRHADARGARHDAHCRRAAASSPSCSSRTSRSCRCSRSSPSSRRAARRRRSATGSSRSRSASPRSPALVAAGRYLLNPMFRILANAGAREIMTAAALLVVLGAALAMQTRRPVDGDGRLPRRRPALRIRPSATSSRPTSSRSAASCSASSSSASAWRSTCASSATTSALIVASVIPLIVLKMLGIYGRRPPRQGEPRRGARARRADGARRRVRLRALRRRRRRRPADARGERHPDRGHHHLDGATPLIVILHDRLRPVRAVSTDGVDAAHGPDRRRPHHRLRPRRPGGQPAAARPRLRRLDHRQRHRDDRGGRAGSASRSTTATARASTSCTPPAPPTRSLVAVCVDKHEAATRIVELLKAEFPLARILVRSFDRQHAVELVQPRRRVPGARDLRVGDADGPQGADPARRRARGGRRDHGRRPPPRRRPLPDRPRRGRDRRRRRRPDARQLPDRPA